ncbi:glycoside hydrolase family 75 protein [Neobacillus ginsengisoli]|uniref:Uncharacterized protein n=1 Tax=Neobacillus ginsengisoli TaxID=904295 RepID=A0ABT9XZI1_9BACI|nr:glycoside hydrolase family 75 protein [Neobacillus ginsengisoli]MDQ0200992.1 hypothetical protein [Neobacillus ginsengisoli]
MNDSEYDNWDKKITIIEMIYDANLDVDIPICKIRDKKGFFFTSKMDIDADGAYRACHPNDIGFDSFGNVWWSLIPDPENPGDYIKQKSTDPAPGYYVIQTSLEFIFYDENDPKRYVDSETIPYFVLPYPSYTSWGTKSFEEDVVLGDIGMVYNKANGRMAFAIFADAWPTDEAGISRIGEGSIKLACLLGMMGNPRNGGGTTKREIVYLVFPGSGAMREEPNKPITIEEIDRIGKRKFEEWGGMEQLKSILHLANI